MIYLIQSAIFFLFWLLLSGHFDSFHIISGLGCSILVAYISGDLLFGKSSVKNRLVEIIRFLTYIPWLLWQIVLANFYVAYLVLHPRMPINPQISRFKTPFKKDSTKTTLANSITLTPGTITVLVTTVQPGQEGGGAGTEYYVHALNKRLAEDVLSGPMIRKVASIWGEKTNA
ncbi:MAG: Na+/H+ antiporter subunit E [Planctomycetota bacterium]|nr:Na+/H+ antiporter subunit E [Planctomycetota bacterium]